MLSKLIDIWIFIQFLYRRVEDKEFYFGYNFEIFVRYVNGDVKYIVRLVIKREGRLYL